MRAFLWRDRRARIEESAKKVGDAFNENRMKEAHAGLRRIRETCPGSKCQRMATPSAVLLADGTMAATYEAMRGRWLEFFANQELAEVMEPGEFAERFRAQLMDRNSRDWSDHPGGCIVPTIAELESGFRRAHRGRQTGLDGLPDDLLAALPCEMARIWHPLMVKMGGPSAGAARFQGRPFRRDLQG